jgi:hypothetical protein
MKSYFFWLALGAMLFALCLPAQAQQPKKVPRIGFVAASGSEGPSIPPFGQGLRALGYIEGKTSWLSIATLREWRTASRAL